MSESNSIVLNITARGGKNLKNTEKFSSQDPYLNLWVTSNKRKVTTRVHSDGGTQAVWGDSFELVIADASQEFLYLEVMNQCRFTSDRLIGRAKVSIKSFQKIDENVKEEEWFKILSESGKPAGDIQLEVCWRRNETRTSSTSAQGGMARSLMYTNSFSNPALSSSSSTSSDAASLDGFSTVGGTRTTPATEMPQHSPDHVPQSKSERNLAGPALPQAASAPAPNEINTYIRQVPSSGGASNNAAADDGFSDGFSTVPTGASHPHHPGSHIIGGFSTTPGGKHGITAAQTSSTTQAAPTVGGFSSGANNATVHYSIPTSRGPAPSAPPAGVQYSSASSSSTAYPVYSSGPSSTAYPVASAVPVGGGMAQVVTASAPAAPPNPNVFYNVTANTSTSTSSTSSANYSSYFARSSAQGQQQQQHYQHPQSSSSGGLASTYMSSYHTGHQHHQQQPYRSASSAYTSSTNSGSNGGYHSHSNSTSSTSSGSALPPGWEMKTTPEGKPYYVCHITKSTQWERPT